MTKVLHILDHFAPVSSGYTFRSSYMLQSQRRVLGVAPVVLTSPQHPRKPASEAPSDWNGIPVYSTTMPANGGPSVPLVKEAVNMMHLARSILRVARIEKPDVIHAHSPVLNAWPALWAGRKLGIPVVYEIRAFWEDAAVMHGTTRQDSLRYLATRLFETQACKRMAAVVTICDGLRQQLLARDIDKGKVFVLPNGVDMEKFRPAGEAGAARALELRRKLGFGEDPVIGFVGTLYRYEGLHLLVDSMAALAPRFPRLRCLVAGDGFGAEVAELKQRAAGLGLADRIHFAGKVPHESVVDYYSAIDILVYPRVRSRLLDLVTPLKILEALAIGKAVVGSDVGGIREIIRDGANGRLFKADDAGSLSEVLASLLEDPGQRTRLGDNARVYVREHRQWDNLIESHRETYRHIGVPV